MIAAIISFTNVFGTSVQNIFKKYKVQKIKEFIYDIIEDLMNIDETAKNECQMTYSVQNQLSISSKLWMII